MLNVQGSALKQSDKIADLGSEPELRHACVERSTLCCGSIEVAERVILIHPNKEASGPLNRARVGARVGGHDVVYLKPIQVVAFLLPECSPAGGPTVSVQTPLSSTAGRAPGATF